MNKISQAALLALGISLEACAPLDYSELPNKEEAPDVQQSIKEYNQVVTLGADLARKSKVSFVDKYGNYDEPGNEQFALDLIEKNQIVNWLHQNDRIRLYDGEDYDGTAEKPPGGMYDGNPGQEHRNDWLYVRRDQISNVSVYPHEGAHLEYSEECHGHTQEVYNYVTDENNEEELQQPGERFEYGREHGDPAYQDGDYISELRSFFWHTNPYNLIEHVMDDILEEVDRGEITPQQGYDRLYKGIKNNMRGFYQETINYRVEGDYNGLWPLELTEDEILETVVHNDKMKEWYQFLVESALDEYASEFSEHEIETIAERENPEEELTTSLRDNSFKRFMK